MCDRLELRFILVYRPMLGIVLAQHLMERIGKAHRTACLRKRIGKALHQNSKDESLHKIGCLSWFMFLKGKSVKE